MSDTAPTWTATVDLGDGRRLQLRIEGRGLELRVGDEAVSVPADSLPDVLGLLSKASAEATWQATHGGRR